MFQVVPDAFAIKTKLITPIGFPQQRNDVSHRASRRVLLGLIPVRYSCALWTDAEGGLNGDLNGDRDLSELEAAQKRKIRHVLTKARVKRGDRVLEFGSGWCGLAIEVGVCVSSRRSASCG